jgi:type II secretory pathway component PulF
MAAELSRGRLRSTLLGISNSLDAGLSVEEAVEAQGRAVPGHVRGLIEIGSRTGRIGQVLGRFVQYLDGGREIRQKLALSFAYPLISLFLSLTIFTLVCVFLVGMFEAIFKDFGVPLPIFTVALIRVARVFQVGWRPMVEAAVGLALLWLAARVVLSAPVRRSLLAGVPVLGDVWRNTSLAEFCNLLALLLESDVPLARSLELAGEGVGDTRLRKVSLSMTDEVAEGLPLSQAMERQAVFPLGLPRLLRWAEGHQSLPDALRMAGEMFGARARAQANFAGTVLGVLAVVSILAGITCAVVGLFLPLVTLISRLSG